MKALMIASAQAELRETVLYYESRESGLGLRFLDEVDACIQQIESLPNAWPLVSKRSRRARLAHFPYGLVYQLIDNRALILAIAHLKRRPNYWRSREKR
jgi:hypothetical protein